MIKAEVWTESGDSGFYAVTGGNPSTRWCNDARDAMTRARYAQREAAEWLAIAEGIMARDF